MSEQIYKRQGDLAKLIERYSEQDGTYATAIPSLFITRISNTTEPNYGIYNTSLCVVAQGVKEALLIQDRFRYSPADYLVASVDLPVIAQVIEASPDVPYLALKLEIRPNDILEVLRETQMEAGKKENAKRGMYVSKMKQPLLDAIIRFVHLLDTPEDIPVLAPLIKKEIIYRVLQGEHGGRLKQIAIEGSSTHQINTVIKHIMQNYDKSFKIEELAEIGNMSVSSLYRYFAEVTTMSPIQFQKQLRLQEARSLLLSESTNAADVAFRVGYESPSQFSREYSRMFGLPPKEDIKHLVEEL
ncbi:AraC family transcriptional regulator [Lederbergia sp. NSJ-179]|uniref:AraC family transcriptional regulator n=1 Tax=Lederbergia sp. NSJ-179 TaxID=2931402 RepID=UPI001FD0DD23|nr:AraC family transcriptional regulator [Lederbergia sp. NSJ-179]MCJ7843206.1 AraC family transcriptional regulator [Lederbergia sp. NSJ-179]